VYPYEINFHEKVMRILRNENECALERLKNKNDEMKAVRKYVKETL
jgi:hypothetical protein